jgi:hypothetical protein
VLQSGVAVIKGDATVESLVEANFGSSKAEAAGLLGDLKALALPLHDVVVADHALMNEATDAVKIFRSGTPSGADFAWGPSEAAVVVGDEVAQDGVGGIQIGRSGEAEFAGEAILQYAPEAFHATFGLRGLGGDEGDAELFQGATELGGPAFPGELFLDSPGVIVADEDAAAIAVKSQRHTVAAQELAEQAEIAESGFGGKELGGQDFAGGVVLHAESGETGAAFLEPVVGTAIELHEFAELGGAQAALTMRRSTALFGRAQTGLAQETAQGFATEGEALDLAKFFAKVMVVEAGISRTGQANDGLAYTGRQAAGAGPSAVGMRQRRLALLPEAFLKTFDVTDAEREQFGGSGACHVSLHAAGNYAHSLQFLLTQRECPSSHGVTFSRCC